MKKFTLFILAAAFLTSALSLAAAGANSPYKVVNSARVGGTGGFDYVFADSAARRLYIPRSDRVTVFDLDTLQPEGVIANAASVHGAVVDQTNKILLIAAETTPPPPQTDPTKKGGRGQMVPDSFTILVVSR